jgi:malonate-semialdehyde dehydrogenase (acetylating) / methylmalonate-semialdehyde dehydrogenase
MGAKNHCIVMPDCDKESTLNGLVNAAYGTAGQKCMAITVAILVGESKNWIPEIVEKAKKLKIGSGFDKDVDIPPLC